MSYLVLARKWRPKDFKSLVGQDHVVKALTNSLESGRLHHAWLFTGTRGVGKTTLSRILAKSLNCEKGITSEPCGQCSACVAIDQGRFVDYLEFDAASNRRVEEMTQLLDQATYAPNTGRFKIYMIDEVHMLTGHAFNAMLKTLEEPPEHVKFILATTDPQKIPVTVLSRCLQFNLKQMPPEAIVPYLTNILGQEKIPADVLGLRLIAQAAAGSMRDALSLTDQAIAYSGGAITQAAVQEMLGTIDQKYLVRLLDAVLAASAQSIVDTAKEIQSRGFSYSQALSDLAAMIAQIAIEQQIPGGISSEEPLRDDLVRLAQSFSADVLQLCYSIAVHARNELALSPDEYAGFVMAGLRMLSLIAGSTMTQKKSLVSAHIEEASSIETVELPIPKESQRANELAVGMQIDSEKKQDISVSPNDEPICNKVNSAQVHEEGQSALTSQYKTQQVESLEDFDHFFEDNEKILVDDGSELEHMLISSSKEHDAIAQLESTQVENHYLSLSSLTPESWVQLTQQLSLKGFVAEIMQHSEFFKVEGNKLFLRLPLNYVASQSDLVKQMTTLLSEYFSQVISLEIVQTETGDYTARAVEKASFEARQQAAISAAQNNPLVKTLQKEFDARLITESIRPQLC